MKARVYVSLKASVLDPQGQTISRSLNSHGHTSVTEVRQGKYFDITLTGEGSEARHEVEAIARDVLANPVIEDYRIDFLD